MAGTDVRTIVLASGIDLDAFRAVCRRLVGERIAPDRVVWQTGDAADGELFTDPSDDTGVAARTGPPTASMEDSTVAVPAAFLTLCESVILHRDPGRFMLLYRLLWRLRSEPALRHDPLDADRIDADR